MPNLGSEISEFVVYSGDNQPATWGWVGISYYVFSGACVVGAFYLLYTSRDDCFMYEVGEGASGELEVLGIVWY